MNKSIKYVFTIVALGLFIFCRAQDSLIEMPPAELGDTLYGTETTSNNNYQFKTISGGEKIDTRDVSGTDLRKLKSNEDYWYINQKPPGEKEESSYPDVNQKGQKETKKSRGLFNIPWLNVLFWIILIGGFIALLVWFLASSNIRLFRKGQKNTEEQNEEESTEDIFELNFEKEVQKAIDAKDYRMAVRLLYLRTLRDLANRNLITYTHEKTNSDYLLQLTGTAYYKNFFKLTRSFDYTWYGQFPVSQDGFALIQNEFSSFKQQLS